MSAKSLKIKIALFKLLLSCLSITPVLYTLGKKENEKTLYHSCQSFSVKAGLALTGGSRKQGEELYSGEDFHHHQTEIKHYIG